MVRVNDTRKRAFVPGALWRGIFVCPMHLPFINDLEDVALVLPVALRVNAEGRFSGRG